jgi:hypothetical protein
MATIKSKRMSSTAVGYVPFNITHHEIIIWSLGYLYNVSHLLFNRAIALAF